MTTAARVGLSLIRARVPAWRRTVVAFDGGRSQIFADLGTALGLGLFRYGFSDPDLDLVGRLLRPGDLFVDGGANVGLFTLVAARRVGPSGRVVAFEPGPWARRQLEANVSLNALTWVEVRAQALADREAALELVVFDRDGSGLSSFAPAVSDGGFRIAVEAVTLDAALAVADRTRLRLIKLDLEGAEALALRGARETLAAARPALLLEVQSGHLARQGGGVCDLLDVLRPLGYQFWRPCRRDGALALHPDPDLTVEAIGPNVIASADPEALSAAVRQEAGALGG